MSGVEPELVVALLLTATVVLGYVGAANYAEGNRQQQAALAHGAVRVESGPFADRTRSSFERWGRRTRLGRALNRRLVSAGLTARLPDLLLGVVLAAAAAGALGGWLLGWVAALVCVAAVIQGALVTLRWLADRRLERFISQLPQLSRLLANGAQAGLSLRRSIEAASTELAEPARTEMIAVSDQLSVGMPLETALGYLDERLPSRELGVLVRTLVIQVRSGGGVVTALQRMSQTLDARKKLRNEMKSALAGTVYVAYLLPVIGVLGVLAVTGGDREILRQFFTEPLGQGALAVALLLGGAGMLIIRRSVRQALRS